MIVFLFIRSIRKIHWNNKKEQIQEYKNGITFYHLKGFTKNWVGIRCFPLYWNSTLFLELNRCFLIEFMVIRLKLTQIWWTMKIELIGKCVGLFENEIKTLCRVGMFHKIITKKTLNLLKLYSKIYLKNPSNSPHI
jgi:hypothetical protein